MTRVFRLRGSCVTRTAAARALQEQAGDPRQMAGRFRLPKVVLALR